MSRPSPQEQAPVDCRTCAHIFDVVDGKHFRCRRVDGSTRIPWHLVASDPCEDFTPAPASPPVSADREGTDVLGVLRQVRTGLPRLGGRHSQHWDPTMQHGAGCPACAEEREIRVELVAALKRAISSEEARRARPAAAEPKFEVHFTSPVEDVARNAGRALYHAVEALDAMLGDGEPRTAAQRAEAYRQVYLAQERWLAFDPEAQTAPPAPAVDGPRMTDDEFEHLTPVEVIREARRARASEETLQAALARAAGPGVLMVDERKAAALLGDLDHYAGPVLAVEDPRDATIRDLRALLGRCAADVGRMLALLEGHHRPQRWTEEVRLIQGLLADLRSAGVEPTPEAQEGKASR